MHLVATQVADLAEADVAVDLEQTPADIAMLSFADSDLTAVAAAWAESPSALPSLRLASLKQLSHPMSVDMYADRIVRHARLVIVRCLGGLDYWRYGVQTLADTARRNGVQLAVVPGDDRPDDRLAALSTLDTVALARIEACFKAGGKDNARRLLSYCSHLLGQDGGWQPPVDVGAATGLDHDGSTIAPERVAPPCAQRPVALVVCYRAHVMAADTAPVLALLAALQAQDMTARALAVSSLKDPDAGRIVSEVVARLRPAVILNATAFSALRDDGTTVLDAAGVPVLQVVLAGSTRPAWSQSQRGLAPTDIAMNVALPELDGRILTRAVSFKVQDRPDPRLEFSCTRHEPDLGRIAFVAAQAAGWARLSTLPPAQRRVAIILSDYPARAGRAGYAVGLDTAASAVAIVRMLIDEGWDAGSDGLEPRTVEALLTGQGGQVQLPVAAYEAWLETLPQPLSAELRAAWGDAGADPAVSCGAFRFPVLRAGNVLIALQPDRGSAHDRKATYHDLAMPPRHAYAAFHLWLRHDFGMHALVHLGTHGTLEWLPGKAMALSDGCWPEVLTGPTPVIYPFIVNNPGEAMQAKRRISAVTIGHMTPPMAPAGLYDAAAGLEALVEEYANAEGLDRRRLPLLEAAIVEQAWTSGLAAECGLSRSTPVRQAIAMLDARLCDLKELAISDRLHVYGSQPRTTDAGWLDAAIAGAASAAETPRIAAEVAARLSRCGASERAALLAALGGRSVAPGPAGAPSRGRLDVLPTGRNLTSLDPRAMPTRVAATIGARAGEEVVRRHLQDHGDYPRAVMMDMWASASLRTGGDDLAQALWYLGARPQWDPASSRVTGVEILPPAALSRPRIDVTLRVSGLFRDIFESQIALFDLAVRRIAALDEEDWTNPLAAARRRNAPVCRVFGGAPGTFGAAAAAAALDTNWTSRADLGAAYLAATSHRFAGDGTSSPAGDEFRQRIISTDALVHPHDNPERDILDGDGIADFAGGFAAAADMLGRQPALYHVDTSKPEHPRARTLREETARVVRGRLSHPRWIAGMLQHGARGVAEIAQGVDALYAFAATADAVHGHSLDAVHEALIADEAVLTAMIEHNPAAAGAIAARLGDALQRGIWISRRNAVRTEIDRAAMMATEAAAGRPERPS